VKGIAILTAKRNPQAPDMPTMTESGVPGFEIDSWIGIFAPARTPPAVIARLQREIAAAGPDMKPALEKVGGELMEVDPTQLERIIRTDYDRWIKTIKDAGITLD
jgi:tripartite-type tricarboxylate transporter receptor subunit TctC